MRSPRIVLAVILAASGCDQLGSCLDRGGGSKGKTDVGEGGNGVSVVDVGGGTSDEPLRYVALMKNATLACEPVDDWRGERLFEHTLAAKAAWEGQLPDPLRRFCVYTWGGGVAPGGPPAVPGAVRVDPDLDVVVPQGATSTSLLAAHETTTMQALGAEAGPTPARWPYDADPLGALPYVAVVDTASSRAPSPDGLPSYGAAGAREKHGLMMGSLIEAIRCPQRSPECIERQFFAQAFPYDHGSASPDPQGQLGSLGSLAAALGESVARWRRQPDAPDSPLVINMSLGWDRDNHPEVPSDDPTAMPSHAELLDVSLPVATVPATVQAVHNALALAACEGALSFAASGNARGAPCEQAGTMGPAAWESLAPLAATDCSAFGLAPKEGLGKLVYAVGGLDGGDRPIANSRRNSLPARVLYAHQAGAEVDRGGGQQGYSEPWTGTSVATAAMSAIAAQAWSFAPSHRASSLMAAIHDQQPTVSVDAKWQGPLARAARKVTRLDAHSVMNQIDPANNPYLPRQTGSNAISLVILAPGLQPVLQPVGASGGTTLTAINTTATCDGQPVSLLAAPGYSPLPAASFPTDVLRPQPPVALCPSCPVVKKPPPKTTGGSNAGTATTLTPTSIIYELELELGADYVADNPNAVVDQPVLELDDGSSGPLVVALGNIRVTDTRQVVELSNYTISTGQTQQTLSQWLDAHTSVTSARLRLRADDDPNDRIDPQTTTEVISVVR